MRGIVTAATFVLAILAGSAEARPVAYTLHTVTDGSLGNLNFVQAAVTITFKGDTRNIQSSTAGGGLVYTNSIGSAKITVVQNGKTTEASFAPGQIYVRYDVINGVLGFGSAISPTYPITLGCGTSTCLAVDDEYYGIVAALTDELANDLQETISPVVLALPANLSQPTILTGATSVCATAYTGGACLTPAPKGLVTDRGGLFLQDVYFSVIPYAGIYYGDTSATHGDGPVAVFTVKYVDD